MQAVALHPRTAKQMYRGGGLEPDRASPEALSIPVVGNGDVKTPEDALRMFEETGCDGVMIGRASMKNPWIYRQITDGLAGREPRQPTLDDRRELIVAHFRPAHRAGRAQASRCTSCAPSPAGTRTGSRAENT